MPARSVSLSSRVEAAWLAGLAVLALVKHLGVALGTAAFAGGDHTWINLPLKAASRAAFRGGEIPLWNKALSCGTPHLAQGEAGVFYPGNVLLYALPDVVRAYGWTVILHHVLFAWATYALLRSHRVRPYVAFTFSTLSLLSPYAILNMPTSNFFQTFWFVPAIFLCLKLAQSGRSGRAGLLGGALLGIHLTVGRPELAVYGWGTAAVVGGVGAVLSPERGAACRRMATFLATAGAVGVALGAVQVLPTLEFLAHSSRGGGVGNPVSSYGSWLRLDRLYELFLFPCLPVRSGLHTAYFSGNPYVGLAPLALVLAALAETLRRRGTTRPAQDAARARGELPSLAAGAVVALVLALGPSVPVLRLAWAVPPLSLLRYPGRSLPVFLCLFYLLAAVAWEDRLRRRAPGRRALIAVAAVVAAGCLVFVLGARDTIVPVIPLANLAFQVLPLVVVFAWPALRERRAWREGAVAVACLFQAAPLLLAYDNPTLPRQEFDRAYAPLAKIAESPEGERRTVVMGFKRPGPARAALWGGERAGPSAASLNPPSLGDGGLLAGTDVVNEYNEFALSSWQAFMKKTVHRQTRGEAPFPPEAAVCDLTGIRWLVVDRETELNDPDWERVDVPDAGATDARLWRRRNGVPTAELLGVGLPSAPLDGGSLADRVLRDPPDFRRTVLLMDGSAPPLAAAGDGALGEIREQPAGANAFSFAVTCARPAYLLLRDQDYPGWEAFLDGKPAAYFRADGFYKALPVPRGEHEVLFRYAPASFRYGASLSLLAAVGALSAAAGTAVARARARRAGREARATADRS